MTNPIPGAPIELSTVVELVRWRARHQPGKRAFTYLLHGETEEVNLTYGELDRRARAIAAELQRHAPVGARALLLFPPGLDFIGAFFGCLYAGVIAVPAYPPQPTRLGRTMPRLGAIANNARPSVVLTTSTILAGVDLIFEQAPAFRTMTWLAAEEIGDDLAQEWHAPALGADTLAFLQYSSGSTALPKGVMLSHGNLLHNQRIIHRAFENTEQSVGVSWLPLYHDMGLIGSVVQPLFLGNPCVLMSPVDFLQRPVRWLQAISRYRATTSGGPNFAYDLCLRRVSDEQRATLDLSSWSLAFNGAEPIRQETMEQFAAAFASCGFRREAFYPCYGLAEATLFVTGSQQGRAPVYQAVDDDALRCNQVAVSPAGHAEGRPLVGSGRMRPEVAIAIVDPDTLRRCAADRVGEIWVSAPNVGQGYWDQPEATAATFRAYLSDTGEGPFLRTGDLGFLHDDVLFVTGRLKDVIIIRGQNYYPQDIELTTEQSHPAVRPGCCAAFTADGAGKEQLVVVAEIDHHFHPAEGPSAALRETARHRRLLDPQAVVKAIRQRVSEEHELQVHHVLLLKAGSIPKTPSGKIQRYACRAGFGAETLPAWTETPTA